jgi:hypothetical protein
MIESDKDIVFNHIIKVAKESLEVDNKPTKWEEYQERVKEKEENDRLRRLSPKKKEKAKACF